MSSQASSSPATRQVYHVILAGPLITITPLLGELVIFMLLFGAVDGTVALISAATFAGIIIIVALMMYFGVRLVLSEEGIRYQNIGFNKGERGIPWRELRGGSAATLS